MRRNVLWVTGGFVLGVQALIGSTPLTNLGIRSPSVIGATMPAGTLPGTYDVVAINPDGSMATLHNGYTVTAAVPSSSSASAGSSTGGVHGAPAKGCGCSAPSGSDAGLLFAAVALLTRRRRT